MCVFGGLGGAGCVWAIFWFALVSDDPRTHPRISECERDYITQSIGPQVPQPTPYLSLSLSHFLFPPLLFIFLSNSLFTLSCLSYLGTSSFLFLLFSSLSTASLYLSICLFIICFYLISLLRVHVLNPLLHFASLSSMICSLCLLSCPCLSLYIGLSSFVSLAGRCPWLVCAAAAHVVVCATLGHHCDSDVCQLVLLHPTDLFTNLYGHGAALRPETGEVTRNVELNGCVVRCLYAIMDVFWYDDDLVCLVEVVNEQYLRCFNIETACNWVMAQ